MLRFTGGQFRSRPIEFPRKFLESGLVRPTSAKVREALFNTLQNQLHEAKVLDLFAGSGCLGMEALSRGAASAVFVEKDRQIAKFLTKNLETYQWNFQAKVLVQEVGTSVLALKSLGPFDLIFADPPYHLNPNQAFLDVFPWNELMTSAGRLFLEGGKKNNIPKTPKILLKTREKVYGDTLLTTYVLNDHSCEGASDA